MPSIRYGYRSLGRRPVPLRLLLGHWRFPSIRRLRPVWTQADRQIADRRGRLKGAAPQRDGGTDRGTPDGRGKPRWQTNLLYELALRGDRRPAVPRGDPWLDGQSRRQARRRDRV